MRHTNDYLKNVNYGLLKEMFTKYEINYDWQCYPINVWGRFEYHFPIQLWTIIKKS